jgi:hypothetical protein
VELAQDLLMIAKADNITDGVILGNQNTKSEIATK